MDQSTALHRLLEAADLIKMVEDLTAAGTFEKLAPSSLSGVRITLRQVKDNILASHDTLAGGLVARARNQQIESQAANNTATPATTNSAANQAASPAETKSDLTSVKSEDGKSSVLADPDRLPIRRRDLRSSLEQLVER